MNSATALLQRMNRGLLCAFHFDRVGLASCCVLLAVELQKTRRAPMDQQTGNLSGTERAASALYGLSFSLIAMRGGSPLWRLVSGIAGVALLARSYAGYCGVKAALTGEVSLRDGLSTQWDRTWGASTSSTARPADYDAVDECVNDSFPASDPPASRLPDEPPSNAQAKWEAAHSAGQG